MIEFTDRDTSSVPEDFIIPGSLTIRGSTSSESICLTGYCTSLSRMAAAIARAIGLCGGSLVRTTCELHGSHWHLAIELQLPLLARLEGIRRAIHSGGGIIETVQIDYQIRRPTAAPAPDRRLEARNSWLDRIPKPCLGCRYYHGESYNGNSLICAVHPSGPEAENCRDREDS